VSERPDHRRQHPLATSANPREAWGLSSASMDEAERQDGTLNVDERESAVSGEERDERATEAPGEGSDAEPTPGEDPGPMGNPASDEEALRHSQEDSGGGDA